MDTPSQEPGGDPPPANRQGNGQEHASGRSTWPPLGRTTGHQRAAPWPSPSSLYWPPTGVVIARVPSSCQWDGCDRQTAALRWSHAQGSYLAACLSHATVPEEAEEPKHRVTPACPGAQPAQDHEMDPALSPGGRSVARENTSMTNTQRGTPHRHQRPVDGPDRGRADGRPRVWAARRRRRRADQA